MKKLSKRAPSRLTASNNLTIRYMYVTSKRMQIQQSRAKGARHRQQPQRDGFLLLSLLVFISTVKRDIVESQSIRVLVSRDDAEPW